MSPKSYTDVLAACLEEQYLHRAGTPTNLNLRKNYDRASKIHRLQSRRYLAGRLRPQGNRNCGNRNAGTDGAARKISRGPAAEGRKNSRLYSHDDSNRCVDRNPDRTRRRSALVVVQYFLDAGSRRCCDCRAWYSSICMERRNG